MTESVDDYSDSVMDLASIGLGLGTLTESSLKVALPFEKTDQLLLSNDKEEETIDFSLT